MITMVEQIVILDTGANDTLAKVNALLNEGWKVKTIEQMQPSSSGESSALARAFAIVVLERVKQ